MTVTLVDVRRFRQLRGDLQQDNLRNMMIKRRSTTAPEMAKQRIQVGTKRGSMGRTRRPCAAEQEGGNKTTGGRLLPNGRADGRCGVRRSVPPFGETPRRKPRSHVTLDTDEILGLTVPPFPRPSGRGGVDPCCSPGATVGCPHMQCLMWSTHAHPVDACRRSPRRS